MVRAISKLALAAATASLASCAGMDDSARPVIKNGAIANQPPKPNSLDVNHRFLKSAKGAAGASDGAGVDQMLDDGFSAIYSNCDDFFRSAGQTQTVLMTAGDAIKAFGTVLAGALAIKGANGSDQSKELAILTLGTSTVLTGIDIYTRRYLFSAENVDSVRELTLNALQVHRRGVFGLPAAARSSYSKAVNHLQDDQAICTLRHIDMLAREAIRKGDVVAHTDLVDPGPDPAELADYGVLKKLGALYGLGGALSEDQAGNLYFLLIEAPRPQELSEVFKSLKDIPANDNPFNPDKTLKSPALHSDDALKLLRSFSSATRAKFHSRILDIHKETDAAHAGGPPPPPPPGGVPPLPSRFRVAAPESTGGRVSVGIK